eukprot:3775398-Alexandrium_andersonii.AAC.1
MPRPQTTSTRQARVADELVVAPADVGEGRQQQEEDARRWRDARSESEADGEVNAHTAATDSLETSRSTQSGRQFASIAPMSAPMSCAVGRLR